MKIKNFILSGTLVFLGVFPVLLSVKDPQYIDLAKISTPAAIYSITEIFKALRLSTDDKQLNVLKSDQDKQRDE